MSAESYISLTQRSQLLRYLALGLIMLNGVGIAADIARLAVVPYATPVHLAGIAACGVVIWLARQQQITAGTALLCATLSGLIIFYFFAEGMTTFYLLLPFFVLQLPTIALLLNAKAIRTATLCIAGFWLVILVIPNFSNPARSLVVAMSITLSLGTLTWLIVRQLERALAESQAQAADLAASRDQSRQQTADLKARTLEAEVQQRNTAAALTALQQANNERDNLARSLQEATLPVMPVHEGILVLPLIGSIDSRRAALLSQTLLHEIERARAKAVIIDVTGVPIVDTQVALALIRAARATQLLGARTLLVGIRPEVAQTLVQLGVDLNAITVRADLQSGIQAAMRELGRAAR